MKYLAYLCGGASWVAFGQLAQQCKIRCARFKRKDIDMVFVKTNLPATAQAEVMLRGR